MRFNGSASEIGRSDRSRFYHQLQVWFCAAIFLFLTPLARAGGSPGNLTIDIHIYHDVIGYYFYPWLTTDTTPPNIPFGNYLIASPQIPTNGSRLVYTANSSGLSLCIGDDCGGGNYYNDFASALNGITNGNWSIWVTNSTSTNQYTFTVTTSGVDTNFYPEPPAFVFYPNDISPSGSNVVTLPNFYWQGPTNWAGTLHLNDNFDDTNGFTFGEESADLASDQTNWLSAIVLPLGKHSFSVDYVSNVTANVTASVPLDSVTSQPIAPWISTSTLESGYDAIFYVNPQASLAFSGHTNVAYYSFEDNNLFSHDFSESGNNMHGYGWFNDPPYMTNDAEAGSYAVGYTGTGWQSPPTNLVPVLSGSFSISLWARTTQTFGDDDGGADGGAGILSANSDQVIPMALTGSKLGFLTGGNTSDTLHSSTSINSGDYVHLVVTRDQTTGEKKIYVNGVLDASDFGQPGELTSSADPTLFLGMNSTFAGGLVGDLDEVQFYSGVLTADEVDFLFNHPGSAVANAVAGSSDGLAAHYDFDEGTELAADVSGNNNNIVHSGNFGGNGPAIDSDTAAGVGSVRFDGGSYLTPSPGLVPALAGDFSVSLWLKTTQSQGSQWDYIFNGAGVISADVGGPAKDVVPIALTGGQVAFNTDEGGGFDDTLQSSGLVNNGSWHHVVVTRNLTTGEKVIYIDGLENASEFGTQNVLNDPQLITIGAFADASDSDPDSPDFNGYNGYDGLLDDLQVYSRVLSSDEVAILYAHPGSVAGNNVSDFNTALNTVGFTWTTNGDSAWFVQNTHTLDGLAVQSGGVTNDQLSRLSVNVTGPGTLSFYWSSITDDPNFGFDYEFAIDGNYENNIFGNPGWYQPGPYTVGPGTHTLSWTTAANGDTNAAEAGFLDKVNFSSQVMPIIINGPLDGTVPNAGYIPTLTVHEGSNAVLVVNLVGNPTPTISWFKNNVLIPGATSTTFAITNVQLADSGNYYLHASNSLGNVSSLSVFLKVYRDTDLRPLSFTVPAVISSSSMIPIVWTITNTGPGAVSNFSDYVSFTAPVTTPDFVLSGVIYSRFEGALIPPGGTLTVSNLFRFPTAIPAGSYSFVLDVDANNDIIETNKSNNFLTNSFTVINPDMQPGNLQIAPSIIGGSTLTVTYNITNNGPGSLDGVGWADELYLSSIPTFDSSAVPFRQINQSPVLAPGQSFISSNSVFFPPKPSGDYYVILRVDNFGFASFGEVMEANESNNIISVPVHFSDADLTPTNLTAPATISVGQTVPVQWVDQNQGDDVATNFFGIFDGYEWYDAILLSTNQQLSGVISTIYAFNPVTAALLPGQVVTNSQTITIPNVPQGNYYLLVEADYGNNVIEINETNNVFAKPIQVLNPDLVPVSLNGPSAAEARSTVQLVWNVANQGAGLALPSFGLSYWVDHIYISTNATFDNHATFLGEFQQSGQVPSGTNYLLTNSVALPGFAAGNYYLILSVDALNYVYESNETNNFISIPINISSPDLAPVDLSFPTPVSSQEPISAIYSLANVGAVTAPAGWGDRLYFSTNGILDTNSIALPAFNVTDVFGGPQIDLNWNTALAPGNSYTQLVNTAVPAVAEGDYFLLLDADGNKFFAEANLANNLLAKPIHVLNPDLFPTNLSAPSSLVVTQYSQRFEADWSVQNQGAGSAYVNWGDLIYLSPTNVLDTNAIVIAGSGEAPVLGSGQPYLGFATAQLPDGIQGNYNLILSVNDNGSLYESNKTNNFIVKPIQIIVPPVPVLSVIDVQQPGDAWSGQDIQVSWTLTNSGTAAVQGSFYDNVVLCTSPSGAGAQLFGTFQFTGIIPAGQAIVRQQHISLPIDLQGTFWVGVQTDIGRQIFEFTYRTNESLIDSQPLVVHLTPTPNLAITSIQAPTNVFSSDQTTISWIETNKGIGPTRSPYWYDSVYLCDTTNFNTASYRAFLGAAANISFLNPGDSYSSGINVTIPRGLDGTFYFIISADDGNNVYEGVNESDNKLTSTPVTIHFTPTPDLKVTSVIPPHNAFSGQLISLRYSITNEGLGQTMPAETSWADRVYISTNSSFDTSTATYITDITHFGGLIPDDGYNVTTNVSLPVGISGTYYVYVQCDIFNNVYEGAFEDNNNTISAFPMVVGLTPPPDLTTTILQAPTNALSSHQLSVTYGVVNNGSTITPNAGWSDNLYLSTNSVFDPAKSLQFATLFHYGPLLPGGGYTNTIGALVPDTYTGTNYIFVVSDAFSEVFELNKTNNVGAATNPVVIVSQPADLVPIALQAPSVANVGAAMLVSWSVTNRGAGDSAVNSWNDRVVLAQNTLLGAPSDVQLASVLHFGLLAAGDSYTTTNQLVSIPPVAPGTYYLFLIADANNYVYEGTNKNNNVFGPVPITVTAHSADLQVTTASGPTNAFSGSSVNVQWTIKNGGDQLPSSTYWVDAIYLSPDGFLGLDSILLGYTQNPTNLVPGSSYTNSMPVTLPVNVQSNYYFVVVSDPNNYVSEPGLKNNNTYTVTPPVFITLSQIPDLAVTSVDAPATAYEGQTFTMSWVVKNIGNAPANGDWFDVAYLSLDQFLDPSADTYLGFVNRPHNLAPGESYTNTASFLIPEGYSGPFYVFISADYSQAIYERNLRDNNTAYDPQVMQIQLLPPVDLVAGMITIPANATPGQNLTVTYSVFNQGANTALGAWQDSLFISSDTNWDTGDKLFAKVQHSGDVPPGSGYTNTVTATLPGVVPGDYYVIVRSDILNHLIEANKTNNIGASLGPVSTDVPRLTLGTPANGTIAQGQSAFYKFDATNGQTIHVQFSTGNQLSDNEVFVKFGEMPTIGDFDYAANDPFVANPEIYIAVTNTGTYYLATYSEYMPATSPYTILVEVLPFTVREVQPQVAGDKGQTTFAIRGALFDATTQFQLVNNGTNIYNAINIYPDDSTSTYVTFDLLSAPNGTYDLVATSGLSNVISATLSNAVTVVSGEGAFVDAVVDAPLAFSEPQFGWSTHGGLIDYGNSGDSDIASPLILVQGHDTLIGTSIFTLGTNTIEFLGRSLEGPANILRPQWEDSVLIYFRATADDHYMNTWSETVNDTRPLLDPDWQSIEASVKPSGVNEPNWLTFWSNVRTRVGGTWGDYVSFLNRIATQFPPEERDVKQMIGYLYTNQVGFQASATLSGTLLGATDSQPQANLELDLTVVSTNTTSGSIIARAITDDSGQFTFPYVGPGHYQYSISDNQFDMDRDGAADTNYTTVDMATTDLANQNLYLYQPKPPVAVTNDEDPTLVLDSLGTLHAFWYRHTGLWHAINQGGQWVNADRVVTNLVGGVTVGSGAKLIDSGSPGLILVWSQSTSNNVELFYSVAKYSAGNYSWSEPVALTSDVLAQNTSPAIAVRNDGTAVITYLKQASQSHDDSDVYYSIVNIASGNLVWKDFSVASALAVPRDFTRSYDPVTGQFSFGYEKAWSFDFGSEQIAFKASASANGSSAGCGAKASLSAGLDVVTTSAQDSQGAGGSITANFAWQINPDQCNWEFDSATFDINGKLTYTMKNAASRILRAIPYPVPKAAAVALDDITDFARGRGLIIENSVGITGGLGLNGLGWTHAPSPIQEWRDPDSWGRDVVTFDTTVTLGGRLLGKNEVLDTSLQPVDFSFWHPDENIAVVTGTNGPGAFVGAEGTVKLSALFEVYPSFHLRNLTSSGLIKISFSPYFSFSHNFSADLVADHAAPAVVPRGGGPIPYPSEWTFSYDPAPFVGSTNVFGTNSVLSNVSSDLYQDGAPSLAVDSNDVPFQVWYKFGNPYAAHPGSQVYVADFNGVNWNAPVVIPDSLGMNSQVSAAVDGSGQRLAVWVHGDSSALNTNMTFDDFNAVQNGVDVYYSVFDGTVWSEPQSVTATQGADTDLQVSRMSNGNVLAVWIYTDANSVQRLMSAQWDGKGWGAVSEVTSGVVGAPAAQEVGGVTYLIWKQEVDANHDHLLYTSQNSGSGWSAPTVFSPTLPATPSVVKRSVMISPKSLTDDWVPFLITDEKRKTCCKCSGGVTNFDANTNLNCGIASIKYNYEICRRVFTYKPCDNRPVDPNNMIGPIGFGPQQWVSSSSPLGYTVDYENDPTRATGPAKQVIITVPLNPNLDPRTFRLGSFGFGGTTYSVPNNSAFYQTRIDLTATKGFYVDIFAGVDVANHQAFWTLTTVDPNTGDIPQSAFLGFLPPDTNAPDGEGFVSYSILPVTGIATGSRVDAQATIVFDNQSPMSTPLVFNTLEAGTPASSVMPLPAVSAQTFAVAWQGVSVPGGPGIAAFDIYVSEDGSSFQPWLQGTTLNQAPYSGTPGRTYAFYSIAQDNSGNMQTTPALADTYTLISSNEPPIIATITNVTVTPDETVLFPIQATDTNGDALAFALFAGPAGSSVGTSNGLFHWQADRSYAGTTNPVTIVVTDNGIPPLNASQTFTITVLDYVDLNLGTTNLEAGQSAAIPVTVTSDKGLTNLVFTVQVPEHLLTNWTITAVAPEIASATLQDFTTNIQISLSTTAGQSLQGTQQVSLLNFTAVANQPSSFISLPVVSTSGIKPDGTAYTYYTSHPGSVAVIQNQPLLKADISSNSVRNLTFFGRLGTNYQLQFSTNIGIDSSWQPMFDYTQTNGIITVPVNPIDQNIYYRLHQQ